MQCFSLLINLKNHPLKNSLLSVRRGKCRRTLSLTIAAICFVLQAHSQGDLLLYPKRIIFEDGKKSQVLNVANTGKDSVRYRISVVQMKMKEDGTFETITSPDADQNFADKNFRFYPRTVVLGPNEAQTVKIQVTNTGGLKDGEYRSHLYFRAEADKKPLGEEETNKDSSAISVKISAVFGISIPVIIRIGNEDSLATSSVISVADAKLTLKKDVNPTLLVKFSRTGKYSVYGDINVHHISPEGKNTLVGQAKGMAIYTPNAIRYFNMQLDGTKAIDYSKGKLKITYTRPAEARSSIMAEKEISLN